MNYILMMILAFVALTCIGFFYHRKLRCTGVESMAMAVCTVILVLLISGLFQAFFIGLIILLALAAFGLVLYCMGARSDGLKKSAVFFSPGYMFILAGFLYSLIAFYGSNLLHWDEFHQWGASIKYMVQTGNLPIFTDFVGGVHNPAGTGLFSLYFQMFTGLSEPGMYSSSFLLMWTGLALPLTNVSWKGFYRALAYGIIAFFTIYLVYYYPYQTLYVDLHVGTWAGGLCAWFCLSKDKRKKFFLPAAILIVISLFKWSVGPLFACATLGFMIAVKLMNSPKEYIKSLKKPEFIRIAIVLVCCIVGVFLWNVIVNTLTPSTVSLAGSDFSAIFSPAEGEADKLTKTIAACIEAFISRAMHSGADISLSMFMFMLVALCVGIAFYLFIGDKFKKLYKSVLILLVVGFAVYFLVIIYSYTTTFHYDESTNATAIARFFASYALLVLPLLFIPLYTCKMTPAPTASKAAAVISLLLIVATSAGINADFLSNATFLNAETVPDYDQIERVREASDDILEEVQGENVYMISQTGNNKPISATRYYMGIQSSLWTLPWQFYDGGAKRGNFDYESPDIYDLPTIWSEGNFAYVWIIESNEYLEETLPEVADMETPIEGGLYHVDYLEDGVSLNLVGEY